MSDTFQRRTLVPQILIETGVKIQINMFGMIGLLMILRAKTFFTVSNTPTHLKYPNRAKIF